MIPQHVVQLSADQIQAARELFEFVGGNTANALRIAVNKTLPKARTAASRSIRQQLRLPASFVADKLSIIKATTKSPSGRLRAMSRGLLLSRFSTDATVASDKVGWFRPPLVPPGGIRVRIKPAGPAKVVTGDAETHGNKPFYLIINRGANIGIAARYASGARSATGQRKIKVFYGPSVSQVFSSVREDIAPSQATEFSNQLLDAMRYLLIKQYPPEPVDV